MIRCANCGAELKEGVRFCVECGYAVSQDAAAPVSAPEEATEAISSAEQTVSEAAEVTDLAAPEAESENTAPAAPSEPGSYSFAPAAPAYSAPQRSAEPEEAPGRPPKKSRWEIMSGKGTLGAILLMSIPLIGLILMIAWSCGACRKYSKRNLARAMLILFCACLVLTVAAALVVRFVFPDTVVAVFEALFPGYTLSF